MPPEDSAAQRREHGIALLRGAFSRPALGALRDAAVSCFQSIANQPAPPHYRFSRASHSVVVSALSDFGIVNTRDLVAPLSAPGLADVFTALIGPGWTCNLEQSWVRKKFAPRAAPAAGYHIQDWHQDGALGVRFPPEPGPEIPMTPLLICWIPLDPCGFDSPGLEFVRRRQPALLHFTELADAAIRNRFPPQEFWAPALEIGDGLVFTNDILHRTHVLPGMQKNRISVEYRIFPTD